MQSPGSILKQDWTNMDTLSGELTSVWRGCVARREKTESESAHTVDKVQAFVFCNDCFAHLYKGKEFFGIRGMPQRTWEVLQSPGTADDEKRSCLERVVKQWYAKGTRMSAYTILDTGRQEEYFYQRCKQDLIEQELDKIGIEEVLPGPIDQEGKRTLILKETTEGFGPNRELIESYVNTVARQAIVMSQSDLSAIPSNRLGAILLDNITTGKRKGAALKVANIAESFPQRLVSEIGRRLEDPSEKESLYQFVEKPMFALIGAEFQKYKEAYIRQLELFSRQEGAGESSNLQLFRRIAKDFGGEIREVPCKSGGKFFILEQRKPQ